MDRRAKIFVAVIACIIPIVLVVWAMGNPTVVFTHQFGVSCNWECIDEQSFEVDVGWPYWQIKVDIEVEGVTGHHPDPSIIKTIEIRDSAGGLVRFLNITEVGNYTTDWFYITQVGGPIPIHEIYNITARGNGYFYGGFHGQLTVYARGVINVFYYGEYPEGYSPP
jgi:hypothetical protein